MPPLLETAGERVAIESSLDWVTELIAEGSDGALRNGNGSGASMQVAVEADRRPFHTRAWEPLARGAWRHDGQVVIENACTSGFDLHFQGTLRCGRFTYRWRPPARDRAVGRLLRSRFHLLARAALVQYPALWWAGVRGRAPLHASACTAGSATPLIAAPSGIGRSTLLARELARGERATGDNLTVGDGYSVWGLVEPLRVEGGTGRRMPHGRRESKMEGRVDALTPDSVVVLARGGGDRPELVPCEPERAARSLIASTFMAGELRRYWAFAATLALGTGLGPAHSRVAEVASEFTDAVPCFSLAFSSPSQAELAELFTGTQTEVEV